MTGNLRTLRDAVLQRGREVEVTEEGEVREVSRRDADVNETKSKSAKPTKLAERTFGHCSR